MKFYNAWNIHGMSTDVVSFCLSKKNIAESVSFMLCPKFCAFLHLKVGSFSVFSPPSQWDIPASW